VETGRIQLFKSRICQIFLGKTRRFKKYSVYHLDMTTPNSGEATDGEVARRYEEEALEGQKSSWGGIRQTLSEGAEQISDQASNYAERGREYVEEAEGYAEESWESVQEDLDQIKENAEETAKGEAYLGAKVLSEAYRTGFKTAIVLPDRLLKKTLWPAIGEAGRKIDDHFFGSATDTHRVYAGSSDHGIREERSGVYGQQEGEDRFTKHQTEDSTGTGKSRKSP
jgi:hypothetical protein